MRLRSQRSGTPNVFDADVSYIATRRDDGQVDRRLLIKVTDHAGGEARDLLAIIPVGIATTCPLQQGQLLHVLSQSVVVRDRERKRRRGLTSPRSLRQHFLPVLGDGGRA